MDSLADAPPSKDRYLEALDFFTNFLREHEKSLDKSIVELANFTELLGSVESPALKLDALERKIALLQKQIAGLVDSARKMAEEKQEAEESSEIKIARESVAPRAHELPFVTIRCAQWSDFQSLATHAEALSFRYNEDTKILQVEAVRGNQIISYGGAPPGYFMLLKTWLAQQTVTAEADVFEGSLTS